MAACQRPGGQDQTAATTTTPVGTGSTQPTSVSPTPTTPPAPPVTTDADCPYLQTPAVEEIVGQQITRTTTSTDPATPQLPPGCTFYKPNDEIAAAVAITAYPGPVEAQIAAAELGTPAANPVDSAADGGVADGGVVLVTADQTVLAVTQGPALLVVTINQESSLEAQELAQQVAPALP